jgi:hypothetical protein
MPVDTGTRLGPYEIVAPSAQEEWARSTKAAKPAAGAPPPSRSFPHMSDRPELRQRFEEEARAVSILNHPHLCTVYDVGRETASTFWSWSTSRGTGAERLKPGTDTLKGGSGHAFMSFFSPDGERVAFHSYPGDRKLPSRLPKVLSTGELCGGLSNKLMAEAPEMRWRSHSELPKYWTNRSTTRWVSPRTH